MNKITEDVIVELTGIPVKNIEFFQQAFCHKSAIKELGLELSNERVEFIGDAVLNLVVGSFLFNKFNYEDEGFLTRLRTKLVSGSKLCKWAESIRLQDYVVMNEKAMKNGWNTNPRILEDTFESLIGAIYLDNDMDIEPPKKFIHKFLDEEDFEEVRKDTNYKDILMRHAQSKGFPSPEYKCSEQRDQEKNERRFCVQVLVNGKILSEGFGTNKKMSEQKAALNVLRCLQIITV